MVPDKMANTRQSENQKVFNERRKSRVTGKKQLPAPTHIGHFAVIVVMTLCKKILMTDTAVKIGVYLIGVMVGSVFADVVNLPRSYFSEKNNFFNTYFVKLGWGWTFVALAPFICMTSYIYSLAKWSDVKTHLLRLALATFWWYIVTTCINYLESVLGICSEPVNPTKIACLKASKLWLGYDISGHVFLLMHNLLTISEEVRCFKDWMKLETMLEEERTAENKHLKEREVELSRIAMKDLNSYVKINIVFLAFLTVLWEFMLIISTVYRFHTLSQKIAAAFVAVGCWFISYRMILRTKSTLVLQAGESPFRFTKVDT